MELLSEVTINATMHRVSDAWQQLANIWRPYISAFTATKFGLPQPWGGYARPRWGNRSFSPDLFSSNWPPPATITVKDMLTESTEAAAITVFEGTLHLEGHTEESVNYMSFGADFTTKVADAVYSGTLLSIFTTAVGVGQLNLTLDSTAARVVSPDVDYTASGEKMLIDNLSDMAAFFSHGFYIENGILYLVDMLLDNGSASIDEFGFFRGSTYNGPTPYSLIKGGGFFKDGAYKYGTELSISPACHTVQANIETALNDIKTIVEYERYRFRVIPEANQIPVIGKKITVTNESMQNTTTTWLRVTDFSTDIFNSEILIEGFGVST